jgi:hypothetical protein
MDMTTATPTTEPRFASLGALFAYEYRTHGADHLQAILTGLTDDGNQRREHLEKAACELKALGLHTVADMVRETAFRCPAMFDLRFSPYRAQLHTDNPKANEANIQMWRWGERRRAEKIRGECLDLLRQAGVDPEWFNGEPGK